MVFNDTDNSPSSSETSPAKAPENTAPAAEEIPAEPVKRKGLSWEEQKELEKKEFRENCRELERILNDPQRHTTVQVRQLDLLDSLLYSLMRDNMRKDERDGSFDLDRLDMAMRVQKQTTEMLRTMASIDYMDGILLLQGGAYPRPSLAKTPLPRGLGKRTEGP